MNSTVNFVSASVITGVIVQATKTFDFTSNVKFKRFMPIVSMIIAIVINTLIAIATGKSMSDIDMLLHVGEGIAAGLTASGGYDVLKGFGGKNSVEDKIEVGDI